MHHNSNDRLDQVTDTTLVVGVDIAKETHYACPVDFRGRELKQPFPFSQSEEGFHFFHQETQNLLQQHGKDKVLIGFEPTGHYWMNLAFYLSDHNISYVSVNPMHVHRTKELDDNLQTKHDKKDARVIAKLITAGHFHYPRLPEGVEAELRRGSVLREKLHKEQVRLQNQITGWTDQFFPEFFTVFGGLGQLACAVLKHTPLPEDIQAGSAEELAAFYQKQEGIRSPSKPKIRNLIAAAQRSIAITEGTGIARWEIDMLIDQFMQNYQQSQALDHYLNKVARQMPEYDYLVSVPGIGKETVAGLLAETGPLTQYEHPRQLIKLAGLTLREHSSGKYKGQKKLSKRGRKRLRSLLFRVILPLIRNNQVFRELYTHYISREANPLAGKEAMVVLCEKLLKIFHGLSRHHCYFDSAKMRRDLPSLQEAA